ncbi:MAG: DHHA1 domain-containing protein [Arcobacter sp.]|jgi:nanoRNase/pAp phosphatase (c-di-AMP/oligoRNAs hydrolase)|uniref:NanoRNase / pAp phosphatase n=1 Tax=Arcobacter defluvii TaxID=873191 RepID=A0AAE7BHI8_9BACT|nr:MULTISPECIES: DHHA1 domain-containing protein [Arcobacter]QKF77844.1 nanoRNase / pAp phosphatase [Arcobacter defluvii]RXI34189.1 exopolyphosphatase [Arcobacter defluvii]BAK73652.1 exopolyphosphatase-like protein [Arcobacter sp. L]
MSEKKYRLVTRSDMDGLVCGTLLKYLNIIDEIAFVHPKDMQDGKIKITKDDITTNLPYVDGVYLAFDHHFSETLRNEKKDNHIINPDAPSAAQVVYEYYGGDEVFPGYFTAMMNGANKADSADFTQDDILKPRGWALLSFLMDSRTGLGRFRNFRISNYQLMMDLIEYCARHNIDEILDLPDIKERIDLYFKYEKDFVEQLKRCTTIKNNLLIIDYRNEEIIYPGNRFMVYAMHPEQNISIHVVWGKDKQNIVFSTGKSIINKSSKTNVGELMLKYNGGGHKAAGGCQIDTDKAEVVLEELIKQINQDG